MSKELKKGFNLIGYATSPMGLGEDLRTFAAMLDYLDIPFSVIDVPTEVQGRVGYQWKNLSTENFPISIFFMSASACGQLGQIHPQIFTEAKLKIGYFLWELPDLPPEQRKACELVDQIWCPTQFVQNTFFKATQKLTLAIPLPVVKHEGKNVNWRQRLNIPKDAFVCLYMFDIHSTLNRKNPQASIEVFETFAREHPDAYLILKINRWESLTQNHLEWIPKHPRIRVIMETLDTHEIADLYIHSDCYLSLHRSEGFGRTLVEALQHGLYIVSSHYSGPADYLNSENSHRVDWIPMKVEPGQYPYLTIPSQWSDPISESALECLSDVYALSKYRRNDAGVEKGLSFSHESLAQRYKPIFESYLNSYC